MMSHLNFVKKISSTAVYNRGLRYYKQGAIANYNLRKTESGTFRISGTVRGQYYYDLVIDLNIADNGKIYYKTRCTCPYDWGGECKHVVALLIKFFEEDYDQLKKDILISRNYGKLLELSRDEEEKKLLYFIKGLKEDKLVNFKIYIETDTIDIVDAKQGAERIIRGYQYKDDYSYYQINARDRHILNFLNDYSYSKGREGNSFLLPKTEENFLFLKGIVREGRLYYEDTRKEVKVGNELSPAFILDGDEEKVKFKMDIDYQIYQGKEGLFLWTIIEDTIHPVRNKKVLELPDEIRIPEKSKGEFLFEVLPQLQKKYKLTVEGELNNYKVIKTEPIINLHLDSVEGILQCTAEVSIGEEIYQGAEILSIDIEDNEYRRSEHDDRVWYAKNHEPVSALIDFLEEYEFHVRPDSFFIKKKGDIQEFITNGLLYLREEWNVSRSESFNQIQVKSVELEPVIELLERDDEDGKIDWFEFRVYYNLGGHTLSREELLKMIRYNKSGEAYIQIDDSYYFLQEGKREENLKEIIDLADSDTGEENYRSNYYNILYYKRLVEDSGISFQGNRVFNQLDQDISGDSLVKKVDIPHQVEGLLRNYQKDGFYWLRFLYKYRFGGVLADDMGLGKTIQALTLLKSVELAAPSLIVCPRTLIYNWSEEVEKFFPGTKYLVYYGTPEEREEMINKLGDYEIVITSYSILSRDFKTLNKQGEGFSYCILDEAQHIKNYKTKRARGVKSIKALYKLALTGTPIENSVEELWSIFDFLMPGYLGNYTHFRKNYFNPISNENDSERLLELKKRVEPFLLRRKKNEVLKELPDKIINYQYVEMTKLQQDTYRLVLEEVRNKVFETVSEKGFNQSRIHILAALTKLRQICNHPALVLDKADQQAPSGKIDTLMEMVEEAIEGGHKLVVFSQFVKMLKLIRERFDIQGINYEYLDGSTHNRMERVNRFNSEEEIGVFLISLKAGGVGLNLTSADIVFHVDPWWNPMVERQATDRVHRIGQENKVMVYKLITRGTVEEKMLKLQKRKEEVFNSVIESNSTKSETITWEDIQELFQY
ncbi:MAG: SNF2-related protein [Halanaerobiales bacterium]